jgi:hypothetical protein
MRLTGVQTTEFWVWLVTTLSTTIFSTVLVLTNRYDPWADVVTYAIKAIVDMVTTAFYIWARAHVKAHEALADQMELTRMRDILK